MSISPPAVSISLTFLRSHHIEVAKYFKDSFPDAKHKKWQKAVCRPIQFSPTALAPASMPAARISGILEMLTKPGLKEPLSCVHQIKFPLLGTRAPCGITALTAGEQIFSSTIIWNGAKQQLRLKSGTLSFSSNTSIYSTLQIRAFSPLLFSYFQVSAKSHCLKFFLPILLPGVRDQLRYHGYSQHTQDSTEQKPTG